eukprot:m51a1_g9581 hypothetical protein (538) ;mRNA; f:984344-986112
MFKRFKILLSLVALCALCFPVWWRETSVYRSALPYALMRSAPRDVRSALPARPPLSFSVALLAAGTPAAPSAAAIVAAIPGEQVRPHWTLADVASGLPATSRAEYADDAALDEHLLADASAATSNGFYRVYVVPGAAHGRLRAVAGLHRHAWVEFDPETHATASIAAAVVEAAKLLDREAPGGSAGVVSASGEVGVVFTLMSEDPASVLPLWDFAGLRERYLDAVLAQMGRLARLRVESQAVHYAPLGVSPRTMGVTKYVERKDLPHLIDAGEWNDDPTATTRPTLNFALYVPSLDHSPLSIMLCSCGSWASSYLVPKWGGVVIHSAPTNTTPGSVYRIPTEALSREASAFSLQLRELLGVARAQDGDRKFVGDVYIEHMRHEHRAADWEVDAAVRAQALRHAESAAGSLSSFASLVDGLRYMRVLDHIGDLVAASLAGLSGASDAVVGPRPDYDAARDAAQAAHAAADRAFFDKDVLALLYFPDEHKYAIYVPLFVPLAVQLLGQFYREAKRPKTRAYIAGTLRGLFMRSGKAKVE